MARRCRPRIGAPSPTSWPAGPKRSADTSGAATACGAEVFAYHSCRNRSCPKCHSEQTRAWLDKRQAEMLPCPYFHVTVTVPEELRAVLRRQQRDGYGAADEGGGRGDHRAGPRSPLSSAAPSACSPCCTPGPSSFTYHPHVHCLVTGGGVAEDGCHLASGPPRLPGPDQGAGQAGARQVPGRVREALPWAEHSRRGLAHALGRPFHRLG